MADMKDTVLATLFSDDLSLRTSNLWPDSCAPHVKKNATKAAQPDQVVEIQRCRQPAK